MDLDLMLDAYITCALWSTNDESTPSGGNPLDDNYGPEDLDHETRAAMRADCEAFLKANAADIESGEADWQGSKIANDFVAGRWNPWEQAGHDFWLTRNGHGAGFNDGDWPEPQASRLTQAAHAMGEVNLYVGDDGRIYQ